MLEDLWEWMILNQTDRFPESSENSSDLDSDDRNRHGRQGDAQKHQVWRYAKNTSVFFYILCLKSFF